MHVQIQSCRYVGVSEQHTDSLVVTITLDATCREAVPEPMIFQTWDSEAFHQSMIIIAVCPWFRWLFLIGQHVEIIIDNFLQRFDYRHQFLAHRYISAGVLCLGSIDNEFRVFVFAIDDVYALNGAPYCYRTVNDIYVGPLQSADLTDA